MRYPHWVNYIRSQLESMYDPQTIYRSGFTVYTTLDPRCRNRLSAWSANRSPSWKTTTPHNGALVAIEPDDWRNFGHGRLAGFL